MPGLPPSPAGISLAMILAELQTANPARTYPINLRDADVLALAGVPGPVCWMPNDFWGKSAIPPLAVTAPDVLTSGPGTSTVTVSGSSTAVATGGSGTYSSWAWAYVSGTSFTLSGTTTATCGFSKLLAVGADFTGIYRVTVTDSLGSTASYLVTVELQN